MLAANQRIEQVGARGKCRVPRHAMDNAWQVSEMPLSEQGAHADCGPPVYDVSV